MRRENFPSSRESVGHTIKLAESGEKLNKQQRKALRDYLAGQVSSNVLKTETAKRVSKIREILGYPPIPNYDKDETKEEEALTWQEHKHGRDDSREHSTRFSAVINGIEIIVNRPYANTDEDYELYLPQVKVSRKTDDSVRGWVIELPGGDEEAKQVFEEACRLAKERETFPKEGREGHARDIYKEMQKFVNDLYGSAEE